MCSFEMVNLEIFYTIIRVQHELVSITKNEHIIEDIKRCISFWDYSQTVSLDQLKEDSTQIVEEIRNVVFPGGGNTEINNLIHFVILSELYDFMISIVRHKFSKDDLKFYKFSKKFCIEHGTPKQLGSTFYNFVPNSAVVELSMLNSKKTAIEKLQCFYTVYDYVFVEVKSALISVISKYSEKENDIPIINNKEVGPILMAVILKSRLFYLLSDMYFIAEFGSDILAQNEEMNNIYHIFEECINKILILYNKQLESDANTEKIEQNLNVCDTISFIEKVSCDKDNKKTILEEETRRVAKLIVSATTEDLRKSS